MNNEELKEEMNQEIPETEEAKVSDETAEEQTTQTENTEDENKTAEDTEDAKAQGGAAEEAAEPQDEALNIKYMRLMADFQNYKKRVEKEKGDIYAYANEKIVAELLTVIDNFERALQVETADESFVEGMKMIFKQFTGVLEKAGLEEIEAQGEDFNPNFHNAVMTEDNPDYESGKVTEVLQKGYMLNKKVIRPSMVKVNN